MHVRPRQDEGKRDEEKEEIAEAMVEGIDEDDDEDDEIAVGDSEASEAPRSVFLPPPRWLSQLEEGE